MRKPPLSDADYRALALFRHLLRKFLSFSEEAARQAGLQPQQHQALLAIKGFGDAPTVGELAARLMIRPHSAVGLTDRLAAAGLIRRGRRAIDKRRVTLTLTPAAEKLLGKLSRPHLDEIRRLAPLLRALLKTWDGGAPTPARRRQARRGSDTAGLP